jgi:hypothetical protein
MLHIFLCDKCGLLHQAENRMPCSVQVVAAVGEGNHGTRRIRQATRGKLLRDVIGVSDNSGFSGTHVHMRYRRVNQYNTQLDMDSATDFTFDPHPYWTAFTRRTSEQSSPLSTGSPSSLTTRGTIEATFRLCAQRTPDPAGTLFLEARAILKQRAG